jgi:agmatine deiminase
MPAEGEQHERTIMCWPARRELWAERYDEACADYAAVADAIAAHEPVLMAVQPALEADARAALPVRGVEVVPIPLDDSWARDTGPVFVVDGPRRRRTGVRFGFNGWGEKFSHAEDARFAERVLEHLREPAAVAPIVLEGGSVSVDGGGLAVTTEQCLLEQHRNPGLSREEIEATVLDWLGCERLIWLGRGLLEDTDTDGHVDNICAFVAPGRAALQTVGEDNANYAWCEENRRRLEAAGVEVVDVPWLPYAPGRGDVRAVPYLNYYVCNGAVVVPTVGAETDDEALALLGALFAGREVVPVPGSALAHGGGGVHCITQQVPAAPPSVA